MSDPLQRLAESRTLWLIVAPPLLGFVWQLARGLRRSERGEGENPDPWASRMGVASALLACAATLGQAVRLVRAPAGTRGLFEHGLGGAPLGFDAGFDLVFDSFTGTACALACAVAVAATGVLSSRPVRRAAAESPQRPARLDWRVWAWLELALGGGLLSFLADSLVTMLVGWTLAAAASAWLAGWAEPRAGAMRAARGAFAILALLVGGSLLFWGLGGHWDGDDYVPDPIAEVGAAGAAPHREARLSFREWSAALSAQAESTGPAGGRPGPGDSGATTLALVAFLVAAGAMSAWTPPPGAPFALSAVACGATIGPLGPFWILRLASFAPLSRAAGPAIAIAGAIMLAAVGRRVLLAPSSSSRGLALLGGVPAGLTCIALRADGARGGLLVLVTAGLTASLLLLAAALRDLSPGEGAPPRAGVERALLGPWTEGVGALLVTFERWVVDAIAGAVAGLVKALAWSLARFDTRGR